MNKDFIAGFIVTAAGIATAYYADQYNVGTASNMGPGYYPLLLAIVLVIFGVLLIIKSKWK